MKKEVKSQRLQSLDALRGFDMFFIMGGGALFAGLATCCPIPFFQAIARQMEHVPWHGVAFEDMIFPLFLFIAGISFPYSLEKQKACGMSSAAIYRKVTRRDWFWYCWVAFTTDCWILILLICVMPVFWDVSACPGCLQPCFF